jgi:polysaccharide export outer membrane protein
MFFLTLNEGKKMTLFNKQTKIKTGFTAFFFLFSILISNDVYSASSKNKSNDMIKTVRYADRYDYQIGPEDVLEIQVWKNEELSKIVIVRPDGKISLPLIGDVMASGLNPEKLKLQIIKALKKYQDTPVVSVIVQEVNSYKIFILGEVATPGTYIVKRRTTLLQALAIAGGFSQFASKSKIILIRERDKRGTEKKIVVNFKDIVSERKLKFQNLVINPGDTIFVP